MLTIKTPVPLDVVLISLLLTLNIIHTFLLITLSMHLYRIIDIYLRIDKTCFFFKLLLILPIHKLTLKRDTLV